MYAPLPPEDEDDATVGGRKRTTCEINDNSGIVTECKRLNLNRMVAYTWQLCKEIAVNQPQIILCRECGDGGHVYHIRCVKVYLEHNLKTLEVVDLSEIRATKNKAQCPVCRRQINFIYVTGFMQMMKSPFLPPGIDLLEMHSKFRRACSFLRNLAAFSEGREKFPSEIDEVGYALHKHLGIPQNVFFILQFFLNQKFSPVDFILASRLNIIHLQRKEKALRLALSNIESKKSLFDE